MLEFAVMSRKDRYARESIQRTVYMHMLSISAKRRACDRMSLSLLVNFTVVQDSPAVLKCTVCAATHRKRLFLQLCHTMHPSSSVLTLHVRQYNVDRQHMACLFSQISRVSSHKRSPGGALRTARLFYMPAGVMDSCCTTALEIRT